MTRKKSMKNLITLVISIIILSGCSTIQSTANKIGSYMPTYDNVFGKKKNKTSNESNTYRRAPVENHIQTTIQPATPSHIAPSPLGPVPSNPSNGKNPTLESQNADMESLPAEVYEILEELKSEGQLPQNASVGANMEERHIYKGEDYTDLVKEGKMQPHEVNPEWKDDLPQDPMAPIKQQAGW